MTEQEFKAIQEEFGARNAPPRYKTSLWMQAGDHRRRWLADHLSTTIPNHFACLSEWRQKLTRFEKRMEDSFDDRVTKNPSNSAGRPGLRSTFNLSNESLNVVGGFADFAFSQARQDLFGTAPFFSTEPVGANDIELDRKINAHSNWKLGLSNVQEGMEEALQIAFHLGTAFPKAVWRRSEESYERMAAILVDRKTRKPLLDQDGDYYYLENGNFPEGNVDAEFKRMLVTETERYFDNAEISCIDFRDIAWDITAPKLCLSKTPVFHRVRRSLLELAADLDLPKHKIAELRLACSSTLDGELGESGRSPQSFRGEAGVPDEGYDPEGYIDPEITVIECLLSLDILQRNIPNRIFAIYSPDLNEVLFMDYLATTTPKGLLPIHPVRVYRIKNRVYGRGFHERYENVNDYVDATFNAATIGNARNRVPREGVDTSKLDEDIEEQEGKLVLDPEKTWRLKTGEKMTEAFQFADPPKNQDNSIQLAGLMIEMAQLRTGISSAAQGELSSLPQSNTATGIRSLMSRAATLLRWPIDDAEKDLGHLLSYLGKLLYANHDTQETFVWGEGNAKELMDLTPEEVESLEVNILFKMVQAQNESKIESTIGGMNLLQQYINLPELEKQTARRLAMEGLQAFGFHRPELLVREAILDYENLIAQLPAELQGMLVENSPFHLQQVQEAEAAEQEQKDPKSEGKAA